MHSRNPLPTRIVRRSGEILLSAVCLLALAACGGGEGDEDDGAAFASTYEPLPRTSILIRGATLLPGNGDPAFEGDILLHDGVIAAVGDSVRVPRDAEVIDASGKYVTPGIIDVHSHLGVYPSPGVEAHADGNEATAPVTADVWAEHSLWPQDPGFATALAGGVTSMLILPGSANLIGGRTVTVKNVYARTMQEMKFPGAPYGLKMACGENPKRVYGSRGVAPSTRMGNVAGYRAAWIEAADYRDKIRAAKDGGGEMPTRDLKLETLAGVLDGDILVHNHCYRADEMAVMMDIATEFGYKVTAFHHAVESYKIADLLAEHGACSAMWADWWGFKMEAYDGVRENIPMVEAAGACAIVHSDSAIGIQRLNQEATKALAAARRAGMEIDDGVAMKWLTLNPARALGIDEVTGSLDVGKMADVVIWDRTPFSVYSKAEKVFIDGALAYDRDDPSRQPVSDFSLGTAGLTEGVQ
jgi:imidazolonepropionase-like amidohydrolase